MRAAIEAHDAGADVGVISKLHPTRSHSGAAEGGSDISGDVLSLFEWDGLTQTWKGYFVSGEGVPGANDLETLQNNTPYWIAIEGPGEVTWTVATPGDE